MANQYKNVNGQQIELTDSEQAELDALKKANSDISGDIKKQMKRQERNSLLEATDWMANSDVTMTDAWKTYRQALRDLPAQSGFPDVDFPTKPS